MRGLLLFAALLPACFAANAADGAYEPKVGDWMLYRLMGMDDYLQRHSVIAVEERDKEAVFVIEITTLTSETETSREELRQTRAELRADAEAADGSAGTETIAVRNKQVETRVTAKSEDETEYLYYYGSDTVPVSGLVKVEVVGMPMPVTELIDFGFGG